MRVRHDCAEPESGSPCIWQAAWSVCLGRRTGTISDKLDLPDGRPAPTARSVDVDFREVLVTSILGSGRWTREFGVVREAEISLTMNTGLRELASSQEMHHATGLHFRTPCESRTEVEIVAVGEILPCRL